MMSSNNDCHFIIRNATINDCQSIYELICELAEYERMANHVEITVERLKTDGFNNDSRPLFNCFVAEKLQNTNDTDDDDNNKIVGFLLFVQKYSTWKGAYLWMEDLYVKQQYRRLGIGKSLIMKLIRLGHRQKMARIEWNVLSWNRMARDFYHKKFAAIDLTNTQDWLTYRLNGNEFDKYLKTNDDPSSNIHIDD